MLSFIKNLRSVSPFNVRLWLAIAMALFDAVPAFSATYPVTSTADSGAGSLRAALLLATSGSDIITFDLTYPATITLISDELHLNAAVTITGPGASNLTISGGGIFRVFEDNNQPVSISGLTIVNGNGVGSGVSGLGGGIYNGASSLNLTNVTLSSNSAQEGGAIYNNGTMTLTNCTVSRNTATNLTNTQRGGGGISNYGTLTLLGATVSDNTAGGTGAPYGGGIFNNFSGGLTVTYSTISGNSAVESGGGISNLGTMTITNSTISGNMSGEGGGIDSGGPSIISGSTISGNTSSGYGGGMYNGNTLRMTNTTISGNNARYSGSGLYTYYDSRLSFVTIWGNRGSGGGLFAGSTFLINTLLANGSAGGNCALGSEFTISDGYNLSDDTSCTKYFNRTGDVNNTSAGLDTGLKNNGGPTQTIALLAGSPAIDAVPIGFCKDTIFNIVTTDQRGIPRPQGAGCDIGAFEVQVASTPPTIVSVSPINGSGGPQTFNATYASVAGGATDLNVVYLLFNTSINGAGACFAVYQRSTNLLYLYNDAGTGYVAGAISPGRAGTLTNSQCTIGNAGATTPSGNNLTLPINITFIPGFSGTKNVYAYALNNEGLASGWQLMGTWVPAALTNPTVVSVNPINGSGNQQTFNATYASSFGATDLNVVYLLFNTSINGAGACFAVYQESTNLLYLVNDAGTGYVAGTISPGKAGMLSNSQCTIGNAGATTPSGDNLTLPISITFAGGFAGSSVYAYAVDNESLASGWQLMGTWSSGTVTNPTIVSVSPINGGGGSRTFNATYASNIGATDLNVVYLLFNTSFNGAGACFTAYQRSTNLLYLYNDAGTGYVAGTISPGAAGTLSNSQCTIGNAGAATLAGNNLTLPITFSFTGGLTGTNNVYAYAIDNETLVSGWQLMGTWSSAVSNSPTADSVSPNSASGQSQTFTFSYSSVGGYANLSSVYALLNGSLASSGGCFVYYAAASSALYLENDAGNAWTGPVTPGGAGALQNSQCTINAAAISIEPSGNTLKLTFTATASGSFSGVKNVYGYATDNASLNSGWQSLGTWNSILGANPLANSVAPSAATGNSQAFTFTFSSPGGFASISYVYALINSSLSTTNGCFVQYYAGANKIYLVSDNGGAIVGSVTPGVAGTAQNSQCTINGVGSAASGSGNTLTVTVAVTASAPFGGLRNVYGYAGDTAARNSGWQALGTWQATGP